MLAKDAKDLKLTVNELVYQLSHRYMIFRTIHDIHGTFLGHLIKKIWTSCTRFGEAYVISY